MQAVLMQQDCARFHMGPVMPTILQIRRYIYMHSKHSIRQGSMPLIYHRNSSLAIASSREPESVPEGHAVQESDVERDDFSV